MNVFELFAKIVLNTKEYEKSLKDTETQTKKTGSVIQSVFNSIGSAFASIPGKLAGVGRFIASVGASIASSLGSTLKTGVSAVGSAVTTLGSALISIPEKINNFGKSLSSVGKEVTSFGNTLTSHITTPAIAAATALTGITLVKGWNRLTQIDEAKAKLRGLGHDAESVKDIMNSALASVKGTAYGMDEAATTSAAAVAAGIKKGEELTQYLKTVGDAAAIAGTSMGDMGAIFNKVVTAGKAQNDVLSQLADKGIPIYQWLADETHHAADEIFEMAKKGEIDTETFLKAVKKHVGGAALEMGNATITGAMKNVWAAVSRIGANFLGAADDAESFAGRLLPVIIKTQEALGVLEDQAKEWGKTFGDVFGGLVSYFTEGDAHIEKMGATAQKVWKTIQPILDKATKAVKYFLKLPPALKKGLVVLTLSIGPVIKYGGKAVQILGFLISNGGLLVTGLAVLAGALAYVAASGKDTTGVFQFLVDGIDNAVNAVNKFTDSLKNFKWEEAAQRISNGLASIFNVEGRFGDVLNAGFEIVQALEDGITRAIPIILPTIAQLIGEITDYVGGKLPELIESTKNLLLSIYNNIPWEDAANAGLQLITSLMNGIGQGAPDVIPKIAEVIGHITQYLADHADELLTAGWNMLNGIITGITNSTSELEQPVLNLLTAIVQFIDEHKEEIISAGETLLGKIADSIIEAIPNLVDTAIAIIFGLGSYLSEHAGDIADKAGEIITAFANALGDHKEDLETGASNLYDLFLDILDKAAEKISEFPWQETAQKIADFLTDHVATATYDFSKAGFNIITELANGLIQAAPIIIVGVTKIWEEFLRSTNEFLDSLGKDGGKGEEIATNLGHALAEIATKVIPWCFKMGFQLMGMLLKGLIVGLGILLTALGTAVADICIQIIGWFKEHFQIKSPSKVMKNIGALLMQGLIDGVSGLVDTVKGIFSGLLNDITDKINEIVGKAKKLVEDAQQWGKDLGKKFKEGIENSPIVKAADGAAQEIRDRLHFSEPDVGPLSDFHTYAPDMMKLFAKGIKDNTDLVTRQIEESFNFENLLNNQSFNAGASLGSSTTSTGNVGGFVQNLTINSPQELDPSEIARQTRNANREMVLQMRLA